MKNQFAILLCGVAAASGCCWGGRTGPAYDRPYPLGQVSDSHWETQQANAEAADFVFYEHEFERDTANLAPGAKKKLMQVALRLEHVPFPVVVEQVPNQGNPRLDDQRRQTVIEQLARLGVEQAESRVVVASALAEGMTAVEGEHSYYINLYNNQMGGVGGGGGAGRFGGFGGFFR